MKYKQILSISLVFIMLFCFTVSAYASPGIATSSNADRVATSSNAEEIEDDLWKYKDIAQLYEDWVNYSKYKQKIILEYLKIFDKDAYDILIGLLNTNEIYYDIVKIKGKIPSNAELLVYNVFNELGQLSILDNTKEIIFAYDISVDNNGEDWQPNSGDKITVTLDVTEHDIADGQQLGIIHESDNGDIEDLGLYTVENGEITFETSGFSVFYGYTVDFGYNGEKYVLNGGSDIYLSELFKYLKIDENIEDVEYVSFSDDEYMLVDYLEYTREEGGGSDWFMQSLQPFDTEEELVVYFKNGSEINITVTDANWSSATISSNETWANGDTVASRSVSGNRTITLTGGTVTLNGTISIGNTHTLTIKGYGTLKRGSGTTQLFDVNGGTLNIIADTGKTITIDGVNKSSTRGCITIGLNQSGEDGSTLNLDGVTIQNFVNTNNNYGAAIGCNTGTHKPICYITINNSKILNCKSVHGGAIYFRGTCRGQTDINRTIISGCSVTASEMGGTIRSNGQCGMIVNITQSIIRGNTSGADGTNCYGGGIYWNAAGDTLSSLSDSDNNGRAKMYIVDCQIIGNIASYSGGAIFNESVMDIKTSFDTDSDWTLTPITGEIPETGIVGTLIYGNWSGTHGGGIGIPTYSGGASEHNSMGMDLVLAKGVFINNNISKDGGGLSLTIEYSSDISEGMEFQISLEGATINDNMAYGKTVTTTNCGSITEENCTGKGGAVSILTNTDIYDTRLQLLYGDIQHNSAGYGGGIYVENTNINIGDESDTYTELIDISHNVANVNGGGIYLLQDLAYYDTVDISIYHGKITNNKATKFGGGIFQTGSLGACLITGDGSVSENKAANGGGLYIDGGSEILVTGGLITDNEAKGTPNVTTAKSSSADKGIGGGIYISDGESSSQKSTFTMQAASGSKVGLYGNTADFAAADVYSSGTNTSLKLPDATDMPLEGTKYSRVDNWYADFYIDDTEYPLDEENTGRYSFQSEDAVVIDAASKLQDTGTFYCLTLGTGYMGKGILSITKQIDKKSPDDENFVFYVTGLSDNGELDMNLKVTVVVKAGALEGTHSINHVPYGDYTVTEDELWNPQYEFASDDTNPKVASIKEDNAEVNLIFRAVTKEIEQEERHWFKGNAWCINIFDGTKNANGFGVEIKDVN